MDLADLLASKNFSFLDLIETVHDPRVEARCQHSLRDVLSLAFCCTLCGETAYTDMEDWGLAHETWAREYLGLKGPVPSHDTFRRVLGLIESKELENLFFLWTRHLQSERSKHVAIDGKAVAGTQSDFSKNPLMLVSCFDCGSGLSLAQEQAKSPGFGEIPAAREIIEKLDLRGVIVSADAAYSCLTFASAVREKKGHYLFALKKNNPKTFSMAQDLFRLPENERKKKKHGFDHVTVEETGHGRYEKRSAEVLKTGVDLKAIWPDLKTVVRIERVRVNQNPKFYGEVEEREFFYVSSRTLSASRALALVREHWRIENQLHWRLDVIFQEDDSQVRDRVAARNLAVLRKIAFNLYTKDLRPISCRRKMKASGRRTDALEKVIESAGQ